MDLVKNKAEIVHNIIDEESGLKKVSKDNKNKSIITKKI